MRRLLSALIGAILLTPAMSVGLASAGSVALNAGAWIGAGSVAGEPFEDTGVTYTGIYEEVLLEEYRWAVEFNISSLPVGATITSATLSLRTIGNEVCASGACLVDLAGYVGNGIGELADLSAGANLLTFEPLTTEYENHDVTTFVTGVFTNADQWAGFGLSRAAGSVTGDVLGWDSPVEAMPPLLTIVYTLPPMPNTAATAPPSAGSPLVSIGYGLLLIAALGAVVVVKRR